MRISSILPLLATGALAQDTPTQEYDNICPGKNKDDDLIIDGNRFRYNCDLLGPKYSDHITGIKKPWQCAQLCAWNDTCIGSTWNMSTSECVLSVTSQGGPKSSVIYMEKVTDGQPIDDDDDDPFVRPTPPDDDDDDDPFVQPTPPDDDDDNPFGL